jgi:hypothetical protein
MKSNLHSIFSSDKDLEKNGIIFKISETTNFLIRRFGGENGARVKAAMAKYYKPFARQVDAGTLPPEQEREILVKAFVEASLVNWEGVEIDGKIEEYSPEKAVKLFIELPALFDAILSTAQDFNSYKQELGNS